VTPWNGRRFPAAREAELKHQLAAAHATQAPPNKQPEQNRQPTLLMRVRKLLAICL
jgi:hypothetical protein